MTTTTDRYFKSTEKLEGLIDDLSAKGVKQCEDAQKFAEKVGGISCAQHRGKIVGVIFNKGRRSKKPSPKGWGKPHYTETFDEILQPLRNTKEGKLLHAEMSALKVPTGEDILDLLGLKDRFVGNEWTGRGYKMVGPTFEKIGSERVFIVPEENDKRMKNYQHDEELLTEISRRDYLLLLADAEEKAA